MNSIKNISVILFLLTVLTMNAYSDEDIVTEVKTCFKNKQFTQGINLLNEELRSITRLNRDNIKDKKCELKSTLLLLTAKFYEDYVGNLKVAKNYYKQIVNGDNFPISQEQRLFAQAKIQEIDAFNLKYKKQLKLLKEATYYNAGKKRQPEELIASISDLIADTENEHFLAIAYYSISKLLLLQKHKEPWLSYKAACKSQELKPAIGRLLPIKRLRETAYTQWFTGFIFNLCWGTAAFLLIFIASVFYFSRPWQWVNLKIVVFTITVSLLFAILSLFLIWLISKATVLPENYMSPPIYFQKDFGSFNTLIPAKFFLYTLVAFGGTICLVISTSKFKHCWTWRLINTFTSMILFTTIFSIFTLRYCVASSDYSVNSFSREKDSTFSYLSGATFFRLRDARPLVLTNPRAYPDLGTFKMDEVIFERWLAKQTKIIKTEQKPNNNEN